MALPTVPTADRLRQQLAEMRREHENVKNLLALTQQSFTVITNMIANCSQADIPEVYKHEFNDLQAALQKLFQIDLDLGYRIRGATAAEQFRALGDQYQETIDFVTVHLPYNQSTVIQRVRGITIREALVLPLYLYDLQEEMCQIKSISYLGKISWDDPLDLLESDEITVETTKRGMHGAKNNIHRPEEKTFYSMVICGSCDQLMFFGLWCEKCNYRCHIGCGILAPFTCSRSDRDKYFVNMPPSTPQRRRNKKPHAYIRWQRSRSVNDLQLRTRSKLELRSNADHMLIAGANTFGTVFKGCWHGPVAIKKFSVNPGAYPTEEDIDNFKQEVASVPALREANVLMPMRARVTKPSLSVITLWCKARSLYNHIHVKEEPFEFDTRINIARQVAEGMDFLHAKNIVHRDLRSGHIFLMNDLSVKIGGYGVGPHVTRFGTYTPLQPGSAYWTAPEVLLNSKPRKRFTLETDVYSYGVVMFELFTGKLPYKYPAQQVIYMVGKGMLCPDVTEIPPSVPKYVRQLVRECISYVGFYRPLFYSIIKRLKNTEGTDAAVGPNKPQTMSRRTLSQRTLRNSPAFEFTPSADGSANTKDDYRMFTALQKSLDNFFIG